MLGAISLSLLAACGTAPVAPPEPVVRTVTVQVAVPVPCLSAIPQRPALRSKGEILAGDNDTAAFALIEEWELLTAYVGELESVLPPCLAK